ncbi:MAG: DinB family protein [Armatimonadota bacterium]
MNPVDLLKLQSQRGFDDVLAAIHGIDQAGSWAVLPLREGEYLHTNGSIVSVVQHIAGCKQMYASIAFRGTEIRWRQIIQRIRQIDTDWEASKAFLHEAHDYWMAGWADLDPAELEREVKTNYKSDWPAWKFISLMTSHDHYHAGQIATIRVSAPVTGLPPDMMHDQEERAVRDSLHW